MLSLGGANDFAPTPLLRGSGRRAMMSELRATAAPFQPTMTSSYKLSTPVTAAVRNKLSDASIMTQQRPRVRSVPLHERLTLAAPRCAATGLCSAGLDASMRRDSFDDLQARELVERQELFKATLCRRACEAPQMNALTCVTPPPEAAAAAGEDAEAGSPSAMALLPADLLSSLLLSSPETRLIGAQLPPPIATVPWLPSGLLSTPAPVGTAAAAASVVAPPPPPSAVAVDEGIEGPVGSRVAAAPPPTSYAQMAARRARPAAEPEVSATNGSRATCAAPTTVSVAVADPGPSITFNRFGPPLLAEAEEALHIPAACRGNPMRTALFAACRSNPESRSRRVAQRRARKAYLEARATGDTALSIDGAAVGPAADAGARDP